jgi:divalent metal cation (Fe/Co/Zn/Cd) transporter
MHADVVLIRVIFTASLVAAGYILKPIAQDTPWISAALGALIAICIILFEMRIRRASLKTLIGAAVGSILGIIGAYLIGSLISRPGVDGGGALRLRPS